MGLAEVWLFCCVGLDDVTLQLFKLSAQQYSHNVSQVSNTHTH